MVHLTGGKLTIEGLYEAAEQRVRVIEEAQLRGESLGVDVVIHYRGSRRHPHDEDAPISWFNDDGRGLLRMLDSQRSLLLPLRGVVRQEHEPMTRQGGSRGPSRTSDLWAVVGALCLPSWFTIRDATQLTGFSANTLRPALSRLFDLGLVDMRPSTTNSRQWRYRPQLDDPLAVADFLRVNWSEWRQGGGTAEIKAHYRYFFPSLAWSLVGTRVMTKEVTAWPTGSTYLEGGPGAAPDAVLAASRIPECEIYCTDTSLDAVAKRLGVTLSRSRDRGMTGRVCVLNAEHPIMRIYQARQQKAIYSPPWPLGLAALDALDHAEERVRMEAKSALKRWLANQVSEQRKGGDVP